MIDMDKVIKGLEHCSEDGCKDCPYETDCTTTIGFTDLAKDVLELLKEKETIVRCKDCKHRPIQTEPPKTHGFSIEFPEGKKCPCCCEDGYYSWYPDDDWFCAEGEKQ